MAAITKRFFFFEFLKTFSCVFFFFFFFFFVFLCFSPEYSTYTQSLDYDLFDILEKDINKYQKCGKILLSGDFNARIGSEYDYISEDSDNHLPLYDTYIIDSIPVQRHSVDLILNSRGKVKR